MHVERTELTPSYIALSATLVAATGVLFGFWSNLSSASGPSEFLTTALTLLAAFGLMFGSFSYQISRIGSLRRSELGVVGRHSALDGTSLIVLIPSYKEEARILEQAILSAALQDHPPQRIVVLIDDPPHDKSGALEATRALVERLQRSFTERAKAVAAEADAFLDRPIVPDAPRPFETGILADLCRDAGQWLEFQADEVELRMTGAFDHSDVFFIEHVLQASARKYRDLARAYDGQAIDGRAIGEAFLRLLAAFSIEIVSFERKQYVNMPHTPNKAMNLNAYLSMMGKDFKQVPGLDGTRLVECPKQEATLSIPTAEFILTLDADSLILPHYASTLLRVMSNKPRIAIAQTPYSAFPNAPTLLERIAGATTDVQYLIHQGFTHYGATFWVGANAMVRAAALNDIRATVIERGYPVSVFIQDRTVIEDTGSTVDLLQRGWGLYNHPERLAYSATPPDFGSLTVQRCRWANGGLLILRELFRYAAHCSQAKALELFLRVHYLISPAAASFGILAIVLLPLQNSIAAFWLPLAAAPYFLLYARDLKRCGYRRRDVVQVYVLNLLLLPVNLAGVLLSLKQAVTGRKTAFMRTPKVESRTTTPVPVLLAVAGLPVMMICAFAFDLAGGRYGQAAFELFNAAILIYGLWAFIGFREMGADLKLAVTRSVPRTRVWSGSQPAALHFQRQITVNRSGFALTKQQFTRHPPTSNALRLEYDGLMLRSRLCDGFEGVNEAEAKIAIPALRAEVF